MVEATLIVDSAILVAVICLMIERYRGKETINDRFDDITEGLHLMFKEMLDRTDDLKNLKDFMPDISLVNQNPLASLAEFVKTLRGLNDTNANQDFTKPRDSAGQYATALKEENPPPEWEEIPVSD